MYTHLNVASPFSPSPDNSKNLKDVTFMGARPGYKRFDPWLLILCVCVCLCVGLCGNREETLVYSTIGYSESGITEKMNIFDLQSFIDNPTLDKFDRCRKDDLLKIAEHYGISVVRQALKKTIKGVILQKLVELDVLVLPDADDGEAAQSAGDTRPSSPVASEKALSEAAEVEVESDAKAALPPFYPFSPPSVGSESDVRLKVRLARMQMEVQERAQTRQAEMELRLKVRRLEIEAEKQVKLRQIELEAMKVTSGTIVQSRPVPLVNVASNSSTAAFDTFDISKRIVLVPHFRETEVDTYFSAFEHIASALRWPKEVWPLLLQCKLIGKAQEVCSALPLEESLQYESVKSAILRAYELVPEAYRQHFRNQKKTVQQTFVEFAREKGIIFDKWLAASKVQNFNSLKDLMLLEDFKGCLSERVVTYLNEQKVTSLSQAAVLAD